MRLDTLISAKQVHNEAGVGTNARIDDSDCAHCAIHLHLRPTVYNVLHILHHLLYVVRHIIHVAVIYTVKNFIYIYIYCLTCEFTTSVIC